MIAIYLSKQQALDAGPKVIQQINLTGNIDGAGGASIISNFSQRTLRVR